MHEYKQYQENVIGKLDRAVLRLRDLQTLRMVTKHLDCRSVMEIGPGRGTFGELCTEKGIDYTAIEASSIGVQRLKALGLNVHRGLFPKCGINPNIKYDLFVARAVLEHMPDAVQANKFIRTAKRGVRRGGLLFIEVPDIRFWKWSYFTCDYSHNYACSLSRLRQLMQEYDLTLLESGTRSQFIRSPFDRLPYLLSYLPLGVKIKTSCCPCAYVIARND